MNHGWQRSLLLLKTECKIGLINEIIKGILFCAGGKNITVNDPLVAAI